MSRSTANLLRRAKTRSNDIDKEIEWSNNQITWNKKELAKAKKNGDKLEATAHESNIKKINSYIKGLKSEKSNLTRLTNEIEQLQGKQPITQKQRKARQKNMAKARAAKKKK